MDSTADPVHLPINGRTIMWAIVALLVVAATIAVIVYYVAAPTPETAVYVPREAPAAP